MPIDLESGRQARVQTKLLGEVATQIDDSTSPASPASPAVEISTAQDSRMGSMVGEYQITGELGQGGMGTVYAGIQPVIGKKVAIKVLRSELSENQEVMDRFLAEARAVNTIGHPNIIDIFAFGAFDDGTQYFVMELLPGRSLKELLEEKSPLSTEDAAPILSQILDALEAAHNHGIVHRDLKPDNIYLADHPTSGYIVKLLDFGIAKFTDDGASLGHTATGVPLGTPVFMSPEQCRGEEVDHRADLYALGVIMYEIWTGEVPFRAKTFLGLIQKHLTEPPSPPSEIVLMSRELEETILWCLSKDKADRPDSIGELRRSLQPVLQPGKATNQTTLKLGRSDAKVNRRRTIAIKRLSGAEQRPRRLWTWALVAAVIVALAAGSFAWLRSGDKRSSKRGHEVTLQFSIYPKGIAYKLWVNDKVLSGKTPVITVPRSSAQAIRIRAQAKGYVPYRAEHLPLADDTVTVLLQRLPSAVRAPPRRPPMDGVVHDAMSVKRTPPRAGTRPRHRPPRTRPRAGARPMEDSRFPTYMGSEI